MEDTVQELVTETEDERIRRYWKRFQGVVKQAREQREALALKKLSEQEQQRLDFLEWRLNKGCSLTGSESQELNQLQLKLEWWRAGE